MYGEDSFFTLGPWERLGLLALSAGLAGLTLLAARAGHRLLGGGLSLRISLALVLLWGFDWLSPQVYYAYYRAIIPDLPAQWVVGWPPPPWRVGEILALLGPATLSEHAKAALGWGLLVWAGAPALSSAAIKLPRSRR